MRQQTFWISMPMLGSKNPYPNRRYRRTGSQRRSYRLRPIRALGKGDLDQVMSLNFSVAAQLVRAFRQGSVFDSTSSSVVLLSSVAGMVGQAGLAAYSASKGALNAFVRSAAIEFARDRIRLNCVAPGQLATPMADQQVFTPEQFAAIKAAHPLGLGSATDVAYAVAFLLAETGKWITGTTLVVDGGIQLSEPCSA